MLWQMLAMMNYPVIVCNKEMYSTKLQWAGTGDSVSYFVIGCYISILPAESMIYGINSTFAMYSGHVDVWIVH